MPETDIESEGNIHDYEAICHKFKLSRYDKISLLLTDGDLYKQKAHFMGQRHKANKASKLRQLYQSSALLRYLNMNQGLLLNLKNLALPNRKQKKQAERVAVKQAFPEFMPNAQVFGNNTVVIYEEDKLSEAIRKEIELPLLPIQHKKQPIDFGFDKHWNEIGRQNVAKSISVVLLK